MTNAQHVWEREGGEDGGALRKSDSADRAKCPENKDFPHSGLGQCYPQHYPQVAAAAAQAKSADTDPLGEPMAIGQVARLLACSVWTVRQRYLPSGLPYFRIGNTGKLLFYRKQVVQWILQKQNQGRR